MYSVGSSNPNSPIQHTSPNNSNQVPPKFEQALVKPESSGSSSWFNPKVVSSYSMALGRWSLGGATYAATTLVSGAVSGTAIGGAKLIDGGIQLFGGRQVLPDTGKLMGQAMQMSHTVGKTLGGGVVNSFSPYESNPEKIFENQERIGQLGKMFVDVQGNDKVPQGQRDILKLMDSLGDRAYRRNGTDEKGNPIYVKMSQDEYRAALLHGAHVVVKGTDTLEQIKKDSGGMIDRSGKGKSSHYLTMDEGIKREQWGLDLPMSGVGGPGGNGFGHLLAGKTAHGDTFFQLEGHGTSTLKQWCLHGTDLFSHLNSLANVGPHGVIDMVEGSQTHIIIAPD